MKIGDRVRWLGANPDGWSGDGLGTIRAYEKDRPYFPGGPPTASNEVRKGPAVCVQLDGERNHVIWASPDELMPEL